MKLTIVSHFRTSARYLHRYFNQMDALQSAFRDYGHDLSLVLGYGDGKDNTPGLLHEQCVQRFDSYLIDVSHGGADYGSIVHPQRFKQLASIGNKLWANIPNDSDYVCLVESDLIWQASTLMSLLTAQEGHRATLEGGTSTILLAPMVLHQDGRFYDTWAFRRRGLNFTNQAPYHPDLPGEERYLEMESVGSVVMMSYQVANQLSWPEEDVVVGLCRAARANGNTILLDKNARVYHP